MQPNSSTGCAFLECEQSRIQTNEVVAMAQIVPVGIDFCASARSPERFEPAMIPAQPVQSF